MIASERANIYIEYGVVHELDNFVLYIYYFKVLAVLLFNYNSKSTNFCKCFILKKIIKSR